MSYIIMFKGAFKYIVKYKWCYKYIFSAFTWYAIGQMDKKYISNHCYNKGLFLSQKFKYIPMWDNIMEPFMINQFGVIFIAGHSFIKGMISDNEDNIANENLNILNKDIKSQLDNPIIIDKEKSKNHDIVIKK